MPAIQVAIGFHLLQPAGHQLQAALAQGQQLSTEAFSVGRQHASGDKARGFAAAAADHLNALAAPGQLMGKGQAHQATTKNQYGLSSRQCIQCSPADRRGSCGSIGSPSP